MAKKKRIFLIEKCAICNKRLGHYTDENGKSIWEMKCTMDNYLDKTFKAYDCCGMCALDRMKQRTFEKGRV